MARDNIASIIAVGEINNFVMTKGERKELARKSQDPEILDRLSRDEYKIVRLVVAGNPNTSVKSLDQLSRDEYKIVRFEVAINPNTSIGILDRLSRDEDEFVRLEITKNPKWQKLQESGLLDVAKRASKWLGII
jgi:FixJ family two-component response regulator